MVGQKLHRGTKKSGTEVGGRSHAEGHQLCPGSATAAVSLGLSRARGGGPAGPAYAKHPKS